MLLLMPPLLIAASGCVGQCCGSYLLVPYVVLCGWSPLLVAASRQFLWPLMLVSTSDPFFWSDWILLLFAAAGRC